MPETRIAFIDPQPPAFRHTDVDGDALLITTADIPGQGAGIYFRTSEDGCSVPVDRLDELIEQLRVIADDARSAVEGRRD